jgi:hypothetical protein
MDRRCHFVTVQSAETPGTGPQTGNLGTAGTSARATLWRTLQRAASALMPTLGYRGCRPGSQRQFGPRR